MLRCAPCSDSCPGRRSGLAASCGEVLPGLGKAGLIARTLPKIPDEVHPSSSSTFEAFQNRRRPSPNRFHLILCECAGPSSQAASDTDPESLGGNLCWWSGKSSVSLEPVFVLEPVQGEPARLLPVLDANILGVRSRNVHSGRSILDPLL